MYCGCGDEGNCPGFGRAPVRADNYNHAYLSDPWLQPDDRHDDECDGRCYAGYCAERIEQLNLEEQQ